MFGETGRPVTKTRLRKERCDVTQNNRMIQTKIGFFICLCPVEPKKTQNKHLKSAKKNSPKSHTNFCVQPSHFHRTALTTYVLWYDLQLSRNTVHGKSTVDHF